MSGLRARPSGKHLPIGSKVIGRQVTEKARLTDQSHAVSDSIGPEGRLWKDGAGAPLGQVKQDKPQRGQVEATWDEIEHSPGK